MAKITLSDGTVLKKPDFVEEKYGTKGKAWKFKDYYVPNTANRFVANYTKLKDYWTDKDQANQKLETTKNYAKFLEWVMLVKPSSLEILIKMPSDSSRDFVKIDAGESLPDYGADQTFYKDMLDDKLSKTGSYKSDAFPFDSTTEKALKKEKERVESKYNQLNDEKNYLIYQNNQYDTWKKELQSQGHISSPKKQYGMSDNQFDGVKNLYDSLMRVNYTEDYLESQKAQNQKKIEKIEENDYYKAKGNLGKYINSIGCGFSALANITAYEALKSTSKSNGLDKLYSGKSNKEPYDIEDFFVHQCNILLQFMPIKGGIDDGLAASIILEFLNTMLTGLRKYCNKRSCEVMNKDQKDNCGEDNVIETAAFIIKYLEKDYPTILSVLANETQKTNNENFKNEDNTYGRANAPFNAHFLTVTEIIIPKGKNPDIKFKSSTWAESFTTSLKEVCQYRKVRLRHYEFIHYMNMAYLNVSSTASSTEMRPVKSNI